jgi:hypothetical protein
MAQNFSLMSLSETNLYICGKQKDVFKWTVPGIQVAGDGVK